MWKQVEELRENIFTFIAFLSFSPENSIIEIIFLWIIFTLSVPSSLWRKETLNVGLQCIIIKVLHKFCSIVIYGHFIPMTNASAKNEIKMKWKYGTKWKLSSFGQMGHLMMLSIRLHKLKKPIKITKLIKYLHFWLDSMNLFGQNSTLVPGP